MKKPATPSENLTVLEGDLIFRKLVPTEDDSQSQYHRVVGMLAYAQYMIQKYQYIEKAHRDDGTYPSDEKMKGIIRYSSEEKTLGTLKKNSESELHELISSFVCEEVEDKIKKYTQFGTAVGASVVASLVYSVLIAIIIFSATVLAPDTKFSRIIRILIEQEPLQETPASQQ